MIARNLLILLILLAGPATPAAAQEEAPPPREAPGPEVTVSAPRRLTLPEALDLALSTSPRLGESRARVQEAEFGVDEAGALGMPTLGLTAQLLRQSPVPSLSTPFGKLELNPQENWSAGLELRQPIWTSGRTHYASAAAEQALTGERWRASTTRNDLVAEVRIAFHDVSLATRALEVATQKLQLQREQLAQSVALVEAGAAAKFDVLSSRSELTRAEQDLLSAQRARDLTRDRLLSLIGLDPGLPLEVEEGDPPPAPEGTIDDWIAAALEGRPELKALDAAVNAAEARAGYEAAQDAPRVDLQLQGIQRTETPLQPERQFLVGVQLSVPLFDGGLSDARAGQADRAAEALRQQREEARRGIVLDTRQSATDLANAYERVGVARRNAEQAAEALRVADLRYRAGLSVLIELQAAQTAWTAAQLDEARARHQVFIAVTRWERATNKEMEVSR